MRMLLLKKNARFGLANDQNTYPTSSLNIASLALTSLPGANEGSVSINTNGEILFTPAAGFLGTTSFTYIICHSSGCCSEAVVTATVDNVLAVEISEFRAQRINGSVVLKWSINQRPDDGYFEVQRSSDGNIFVPIGRVEGAVSSFSSQQFQLTDKNTFPHTFYQVKWVNADGNIVQSNIIEISAENEVIFWFEAFPNPTKGKLNLMWQTDGLQADVKLVLYHTDGRMVARKSWVATAGSVATNWQLPQLPEGFYLLRASHAGRTIEQKILIR